MCIGREFQYIHQPNICTIGVGVAIGIGIDLACGKTEQALINSIPIPTPMFRAGQSYRLLAVVDYSLLVFEIKGAIYKR
jgi:hypothetical protein